MSIFVIAKRVEILFNNFFKVKVHLNSVIQNGKFFQIPNIYTNILRVF